MRRNFNKRQNYEDVASVDVQSDRVDWQRGEYRYIAKNNRYYEWSPTPEGAGEYGWVQVDPVTIPDEVLSDLPRVQPIVVDNEPTELIDFNNIDAQASLILSEHVDDSNVDIDRELAEAQELRDAVNDRVAELAQAKQARDVRVKRERQEAAMRALEEARAEEERQRQEAAEEAERVRREKVAAAMKAFRNEGQDPFTTADVQRLRQMSQLAEGFEAGESIQSPAALQVSTSERVTMWPSSDNTHEDDTVGALRETLGESMGAVNEKAPVVSPVSSVTPAELLFRESLVDRANNFRRTYPKVTISAGIAAVALAVGAWGMSTISSPSEEVATHAELKLPKDGLEFPGSCIDLEKPEAALVKEPVSAWMPLDLRNEAGITYSFDGANGSSLVGTYLIFNGADAYLSACEGDVSAMSVNEKNTNEIIVHRNHITPQFVVGANEVKATPVDADVAGKTEFADPADTEWLVGLLQGDKFTATIDNGEAAIANAIMSDAAMRKDFEQKLDAVVVSKVKDSIKDFAKKSKVDEDAITVKMTGTYGAAKALNGTTEVPGAAVVAEKTVTVAGKTIDIKQVTVEAAK